MIKKFHAFLVYIENAVQIFVNNKIAHYSMLSLVVFFTFITSKPNPA